LKTIKGLVTTATVLIVSLPLAIAIVHGQQTTESDVLMRAMQDEMARSVANLQLQGVEKPYFIEYAVADFDSFTATAAFGAIVQSNRNRSRMLQTHVRVGSYDFDNSEFLERSALFSRSNFPTFLVVEDDYPALRRDIWLATDTAYKTSAEQLERKRAFVKNKVEEEKLPDFSHEEPVTAIAPRQQLQIDQARWEKQLRDWSAIFRKFPEIQESSITLRVQLVHKYLVNSEGTKTRQPQMLVSFESRAATQAVDGMRLRHYVPFYARSLEELPPADEIARAIGRLGEELTGLRAAAVLGDGYSGPVLLSGQGSAELFAQVLVPQLSGQRPPLSEQPQLAAMMGSRRSELADRLNRPVLPASMSVFDDPTRQSLGSQNLIGAYQIDDQGVKAERLSLIEQGILKNLLMSRRPRKDLQHSNGHGRATTTDNPNAQVGNLFIQANDGKSEAELKQELIKMCKAQNLPFGIWIKALDRPGGPGDDPMQMMSFVMEGGQRPQALSAPVLSFKVNTEDGREELIRGVTIGEFSVRSLRQIAAAGKESFLLNRLTTGRAFPFSGGGVPTSIIAPSILLDEMALNKAAGAQQKPALLTHPYFSK
jgi:TldD protein